MSTVQAKPTPTDSLKAQQALINKRFDSLATGLQKLSRTNDSLNKELTYFRAKEDFYVMAVDRQGSHFEWFIATLITIAGLISYSYFSRQFNIIKGEGEAQLNSFKEEHNLMASDYVKVKIDLYSKIAKITNNIDVYNSKNRKSLLRQLDGLNLRLGCIMFAKEAYMLSKGEEREKITDDIANYVIRVNNKLDQIDLELKSVEDKSTYIGIIKKRYENSVPVFDVLISQNNSSFSSKLAATKDRLSQY
ncbi:hypothetical protein HMF3257_20805 [Spirosoma telluris]|uniref:Uncharacterized protein n=1 Tax=Spirosoma telluris TaxID=2183553 RepID=A0A327NMI2_9BACT|nr:hypothetical protein HMF3257_20805 [Spirosoma telluris]